MRDYRGQELHKRKLSGDKTKMQEEEILKKHKESFHGDVRYSCDQCEYQATQKGNLKTHIDSVHGDVQYTCDQCDCKSKWKGDLKKHLESVHGDVW